MVASIICRIASDTPLPTSASRITSGTPHRPTETDEKVSASCRICAAGRAMPRRSVTTKTRRWSTRRWLHGGRLPRRTRKGSTLTHHRSSVRAARLPYLSGVEFSFRIVHTTANSPQAIIVQRSTARAVILADTCSRAGEQSADDIRPRKVFKFLSRLACRRGPDARPACAAT